MRADHRTIPHFESSSSGNYTAFVAALDRLISDKDVRRTGNEMQSSISHSVSEDYDGQQTIAYNNQSSSIAMQGFQNIHGDQHFHLYVTPMHTGFSLITAFVAPL